MSSRVRVYTTTNCPYCTMAKRLLTKRNIPFEEVDLTGDPEARARVVAETGHRTVPVIVIDGRLVGGSDDLHALDREGELARMGLAVTA